MENKIGVPDEMLKAAFNVHYAEECSDEDISNILTAALRWLDDELLQMSLTYKIQQDKRGYPLTGDAERLSGFYEAMDRIRRMFVAPEPEVPEEIKDLLSPHSDKECASRLAIRNLATAHDADVIEAYRRGQQSK